LRGAVALRYLIPVEKRISDETFLKATGKSREAWLNFLDSEGAAGLDHKAIVALLRDNGGLASPWWQQEVAVTYEKERGKRAPGEVAGEGFQIGVTRVIAVSPEDAWRLITEEPGRSVWLGKIEKMPRRGETYETAEGTRGKVASFTDGRHVRLTWQPKRWARPSTLQFYVLPTGGKTSFRFHQERLATAENRKEMRARWQGVLDKLEALARQQ
jgi:uncharacterized protein YndB with AHSA1/START domain